MTEQSAGNWRPGDPIGYIRGEIPEFGLPRYRGERYEVVVPDTLDLQERARLALNALTGATDPLADYEPFFAVYFRANPPAMCHTWCDASMLPKFMEAVALMRLICGSEENLDVDRAWMATALKCQGPDGLHYVPAEGRPWNYRFIDEGARTDLDQLMTPMTNGRMLSTMALLARRDGGGVWREALRRLVDGLIEFVVDDGHGAYFWPSPLYAYRDRPAETQPPTNHRHDAESSRVPHGLVHAYRLTGYEPALELARKLIVYLREDFFTPEGAFLRLPGVARQAHFHAHANGLLAMAEYALEAGDDELMEFVVRSYEWAKGEGETLLGYFPEFANSPEWEASEICEVSDMVALALLLSEAGVGDYWDDADRWTRNMLAEGQLLSTDWIYRLAETGGMASPNSRTLFESHIDVPYYTTERVPERNLGGFAGWPAANDWYVGNGIGIMHCCTVNGARGLYWIWERIVRHEGDKLRVNLLLNRASPWADVDSHIPYQGRVDVKVKQPVRLEVRIPEWVVPGDVRCEVGGVERGLGWSGRYAQIGPVKPGDVATLSFPIFERTDVVHIEKQRFTLVRKGNEVVEIDPPGRYCPLYQRQHYRDDVARWRKTTRFVSSEAIDW